MGSDPRWLRRLSPLALTLAVAVSGCNKPAADDGPITAENSKFEVGEETPGDGGKSDGGGSAGPIARKAPPVGRGELQIPKAASPAPTAVSPSAGASPAAATPSKSPTPPPATPGGSGGSTVTGTPVAPTAPATAAKTPGGAAPPAAKPLPPITMDSYTPPANGTPLQLREHIKKLARAQPKGRTQDELFRDFQEILRGKIQSAERILTHDNATGEEKYEAVEIKLEALHTLSQLNIPDALPHVRKFAAALRQHDYPKIASLGRVLYFGIRTSDLANPQAADPKWVAQELKAILKEEKKDARVYNFTREAAKRLVHIGQDQLGSESAEAVIAAFAKDPDPEVVAAVKLFREEMVLAKAHLMDALDKAAEGDDAAVQELVARLTKLIEYKERSRPMLAAMIHCAQTLEFTRQYDHATQVYKLIEDGFKDNADTQTVSFMKRSVENGRLRLGLIGKPLAVEGLLAENGKPFDWGAYQGKFVLVDFWATWCQPCVEEFPNLKANYERYKERGLEIVGVNLDENLQQLARFRSFQKLPWNSVVQSNPSLRGLERDPRCKKIGVDAIPFIVLIGRDGNVLDIHLRGKELNQRLAELFAAESKPK